jgi:hypothetical protein
MRFLVENKEKSSDSRYKYYDTIYHYNIKDVLDTIIKNGVSLSEKSHTFVGGKFISITRERKVELFFEDNLSERFMNLSIDKRWPVLFIEGQKHLVAIKDPVLKNMQFFKAVDTFNAYQELSMFMGGKLSKPENPMVEISDKDMVVKKGFDKWSFRKEKKE